MALRRPKDAPTTNRRAVTAAATRIRLDDTKLARRQAGKRQQWQEQTFVYMRHVPELGFAADYVGNQLSKLRLYPAAFPPDGDDDAKPVNAIDPEAGVDEKLAVRAAEMLDELRGGLGGQSEVLKALAVNLDLPGECWLIGWGERTIPVEQDPAETRGAEELPPRPQVEPARWDVRSISEVVEKGGAFKIKMSENDRKGEPLDPDKGDEAIRIWVRDPQWSQQAWSPAQRVLPNCEALQVLQSQVLAESRSRHSAGILLVPNDIMPGNAEESMDGDADDDDDPLFEVLREAIVDPVDDPSHPASVFPLVLRGDPASLGSDVFRHLTLERTTDATTHEKIEKEVGRLARGLNLPVEVLMGHQQTTFANAEQVDEDTFEDFLEPRSVLIVDALTVAYLQPRLLREGFDDEAVARVFVWYDPAAVIGEPDLGKSADAAYDRALISGATYRRVKGYSEADAPDDAERARIVEERRGARQPGNGDQAAMPAADGEARALYPQAIAAASRSASNVGARLVGIDRELRARIQSAASSAMDRALEVAGSRLANRVNGELRRTLRSSRSRRHVVAAAGPSVVTAAGMTNADLLEGSFGELRDDFMRWGAQAQADAIELASRTAGGFSRAERESLGLRQAADLDEAWAWLAEALMALAGERLFDPDPLAPAMGEHDVTARVPGGLVRAAIARAGGSRLSTGDPGEVWLPLTDGGTRPAGGVATGPVVMGAMADHGVLLEGYRWDYGPAIRSRPFDPHVGLDGETFRNFDDPKLANGSGWPPFSFYMPGDHRGCLCDATPILLPPEEV